MPKPVGSIRSSTAIVPGEKPSPPASLTASQGAIWRKIAADRPGKWFSSENEIMLTEFVRHCEYADHLATLIEVERATEKADKTDLIRLLKSHGYQTERLANLACKMRLTEQSRSPAARAYAQREKTASGVKPWSDWSNGDDDTPRQ
jgi:hypothetical protein